MKALRMPNTSAQDLRANGCRSSNVTTGGVLSQGLSFVPVWRSYFKIFASARSIAQSAAVRIRQTGRTGTALAKPLKSGAPQNSQDLIQQVNDLTERSSPAAREAAE